MTNGFAILIAQKFGAGEKNEVRRFGALSFGLGILFSILLSLVSIAGLSGIFKLLNVPDILAADARAYIAVILAGIPAAMAYNGCAGILRAVGDTGAPLAFLVLASLLNVGLDLLFILRFYMGVGGAAWATVLSQTISAVLSFCYMWKTYPFFRFHLADFAPDKNRIRQLLSSGLSMALMMSLVFFGTLALQSAINTFGTNTIVAHTGARKITEFFMLPFSVMSVTMATYCGQNLGAGETARIRLGVQYALFLTWGWSLFVIFLSYMAAPSLIYLVTGSRETEVVTTASGEDTSHHTYICSGSNRRPPECPSGDWRSRYADCVQLCGAGRKNSRRVLFSAGTGVYGNHYGRTDCLDSHGNSAGSAVSSPSGA